MAGGCGCARAPRADGRAASKAFAPTRTAAASPADQERGLNPTWHRLATTGHIQRTCTACSSAQGGTVQGKLTVGAPDSPLEREADRVANAVSQGKPASSLIGSRGRIQRETGNNAASADNAQSAVSAGVASGVQAVLAGGASGGAPLGGGLRDHFEPLLGIDLGGVRIHTGERAAKVSAGLEARAWTLGQHVVFGRGEYRPHTPDGQRLLAHELAHVGQDPNNQAVVRRVPVTREEIRESQTSPGGVAAMANPFVVSVFNFGIGSTITKAAHERVLAEIALLHVRHGVRFHLAGHTDSTDTEELNDRLSAERVDAVVDVLVPLGVASAGTSAHGEARPIATNTTPRGRSRNRRVDITMQPPTDGITDPTQPEPPTPQPPGVTEPPREDDDTSWFCIEHPIICALLGGGAAVVAFCVMNPAACVPPIPITPDPDVPEPEAEELECGDPRLPLTHVEFHGSGTKGERIVADPLTRCEGNTRGTRPRSSPTWPTGWECVVASGQTNRWVRAHLLHGPSRCSPMGHLHGPGNRRDNIIISDKSINGNMCTQAERDAISRIHDQDQVLSYVVEVNHFTGAYPRPFFAESVHVTYGQKDPLTGVVTPIFDDDIVSNDGHQPPPCPPTPSDPEPEPDAGPVLGVAPPTGPTIGPAPAGPVPQQPQTGLCSQDRISCAAQDVLTRATFPDRELAVELEVQALMQRCQILQPMRDPARRQLWVAQLRRLAERRVDQFITWWRVDMDRVRLIGPCV